MIIRSIRSISEPSNSSAIARWRNRFSLEERLSSTDGGRSHSTSPLTASTLTRRRLRAATMAADRTIAEVCETAGGRLPGVADYEALKSFMEHGARGILTDKGVKDLLVMF